MVIELQIPEDIVEKIQAHWPDLPRLVLELLAIDSFRARILTSAEVQRMLGFETRWETNAFLKERGAYLHYSEEDVAKEREG